MARTSRNIKEDFIDIENHLGMTEAEMNKDTLESLRAMKAGEPGFKHDDVKRYLTSKFTNKPLPRPKPIS